MAKVTCRHCWSENKSTWSLCGAQTTSISLCDMFCALDADTCCIVKRAVVKSTAIKSKPVLLLYITPSYPTQFWKVSLKLSKGATILDALMLSLGLLRLIFLKHHLMWDVKSQQGLIFIPSNVLFFLSALKGEGNNYLLHFRAVGNVTNYMASSSLCVFLLTYCYMFYLCPCSQLSSAFAFFSLSWGTTTVTRSTTEPSATMMVGTAVPQQSRPKRQGCPFLFALGITW